MKTYKKYSEDFKEQALVKVYNRNNDQTIEMVANELNINVVPERKLGFFIESEAEQLRMR